MRVEFYGCVEGEKNYFLIKLFKQVSQYYFPELAFNIALDVNRHLHLDQAS